MACYDNYCFTVYLVIQICSCFLFHKSTATRRSYPEPKLAMACQAATNLELKINTSQNIRFIITYVCLFLRI